MFQRLTQFRHGRNAECDVATGNIACRYAECAQHGVGRHVHAGQHSSVIRDAHAVAQDGRGCFDITAIVQCMRVAVDIGEIGDGDAGREVL